MEHSANSNHSIVEGSLRYLMMNDAIILQQETINL